MKRGRNIKGLTPITPKKKPETQSNAFLVHHDFERGLYKTSLLFVSYGHDFVLC